MSDFWDYNQKTWGYCKQNRDLYNQLCAVFRGHHVDITSYSRNVRISFLTFADIMGMSTTSAEQNGERM